MPKRPTIYDLNITDGGALVFPPITFTDGDASPLVDGGNVFITANTVATTITDFLNGSEGQEIEIRVDANTTIQHNTNIRLENGEDFTGTGTSFVDQNNSVIKFRLYSGVWLQTAPACFSGEVPPGTGGGVFDSPLTSPSDVVIASPTIVESPDVVGGGSPIPGGGSPAESVGLGVFFNGGRPPSVLEPPYISWCGRSPDVHADFIWGGNGSLGTNGNWTFATSPNTINGNLGNWGNWLASRPSRRMDWALAMQPWSTSATGSSSGTSGDLLGQVAAGQHDSKFTTWATTFQSYGLSGSPSRPIYIRLGWEMDGRFFPWGVGLGAPGYANFAAAWRRIVDVLNAAVPSNNWKFCFCPQYHAWAGSQGTSWINGIWPGDDYVDLVGCDFYDSFTNFYPPANTTTRTNSWNNYELPRLQAMNTFANTHGKRQMIGEFGCVSRIVSGSNVGGIDNQLFMENLYNWVTDPDNNFEYVIQYDDSPSATELISLSEGNFPNAEAQYLNSFADLPHPW